MESRQEGKVLLRKESIASLSRIGSEGAPRTEEETSGCLGGRWRRRGEDSGFRQYVEEETEDMSQKRWVLWSSPRTWWRLSTFLPGVAQICGVWFPK